jgi:hypothetical protein
MPWNFIERLCLAYEILKGMWENMSFSSYYTYYRNIPEGA